MGTTLFRSSYPPILPIITDEINKSNKDGSIAHKREVDRNNKDDDSAHNSSTVHGFSTEQCINIESLNVQKQLQADRTAESAIVASSVEESDSARQV